MPNGLGDTLESKEGPLPVWAWAALGTAGLAGFLYYRSKKNASAVADQQAQQGIGGTGSDSSNLGTVPLSNLTTAAQPMPIQMGDTFVDVSPPNVTTPVTVNPGGPDITVNNQPPPPLQPPPAAKPPAKPPAKPAPPRPPAKVLKPAPKPAPPKAPAQTVYTVVNGDSLWKIAQKFYGNGALWTQIYNANKAKIGANPNLIHTGLQLVIPGK